MTDTERIAEIRERAEAATPGPWTWRGNTDVHSIYLSTKHGGMLTVMGFDRWGMQSAQPVFRGEYRMEQARDLPVFQVCPEATDRSDPRVYRADFFHIRHPGTEFIAHAREDIDYLLERIAELEVVNV